MQLKYHLYFVVIGLAGRTTNLFAHIGKRFASAGL